MIFPVYDLTRHAMRNAPVTEANVIDIAFQTASLVTYFLFYFIHAIIRSSRQSDQLLFLVAGNVASLADIIKTLKPINPPQ
jgi:hypothetical protein